MNHYDCIRYVCMYVYMYYLYIYNYSRIHLIRVENIYIFIWTCVYHYVKHYDILHINVRILCVHKSTSISHNLTYEIHFSHMMANPVCLLTNMLPFKYIHCIVQTNECIQSIGINLVKFGNKLICLKSFHWNIQRCYRNPYRLCDLSEMNERLPLQLKAD